MGNSNSTAGGQQPLQWSQSLDGGPDSRNRMKSGYFPPRHYISHSHGGMVPPQKVLPAVNPAKEALRLKPTSNGAILHKGGTISGRKIQQLSELDASGQEVEMLARGIRKRHLSSSSIIMEGDAGDSEFCGRSTPNLASLEFHSSDFSRRSQRSISGHTINFDRGSLRGGTGGRDYDSEPEIRESESFDQHLRQHESPERSVSPLPNSFTLISESPAKKQIRTKKKYQAPPPPVSPPGSAEHSGSIASGFEFHDPRLIGMITPTSSNNSGKKKLQRLFKTKAQSKQIQREEEQGQRILAESLMQQTSATSSVTASQMQIPHVRISRNSHNYNSKQWSGKDRRSEVQLLDKDQTQRQQQQHHQDQLRSPKTGTRMDEPDGRRRMSSSEIAAAAAAAAGRKKKPFGNPLDAAKEDAVAGVVEVLDESGRRTPFRTTPTTTTTAAAAALSTHQVISGRQSSSSSQSLQASNRSHAESRQIQQQQHQQQQLHKMTDVTDSGPTKKTFYFGMESNEQLSFTRRQSGGESSRRSEEAAAAAAKEDHVKVSRVDVIKENKQRGKNNEGISHRDANSQSSKNNKGPANSSSTDESKYKVGQRSSSSHSQQQQKYHQDELSKVVQSRAPAPTTVNYNNNNNNNNSKAHNKTEEQSPPPPPPPQPNKIVKSTTTTTSTTIVTTSSHSNKLKQISQRSDSESDGFNHNNINNINNNSNNNNNNSNSNSRKQARRKAERDSSSDLSSSDIDIPILIRPTLPQRRLDLPRFSPSAAWRALDSPRASGRSLSSEDGFSYEDRIQRYTRPSAPPRNNNERSGDSGISAGDAGSPANAPPDLGRHSSCSLSIGNDVMSNNYKNKLRKGRGDSPIKSDQKCWTPEQDLDESSSEFEHDVDLGPHHGVMNGSGGSGDSSPRNHKSVPIGLQTPPKLTTRSQLFSKEYESEPNRMYSRSSKTTTSKNHSSVVEITNDSSESKRVIHHRVIGKNRYPANQPKQPSYSLDTNWFLSRSEPNSLNVLGVGAESSGGGRKEPWKQRQAKLSVAPNEPSDYLDKVFATTEPSRHHTVGEFEENGMMVREMNTTTMTTTTNNGSSEVRSEIGYGPSSMNFYSPSSQLPAPPPPPAAAQSPFYDQDSKSNSLILFKRPFAHIMYLPSYDSRRFHHPSSSHYYANSRRTKSVDNLDATESHRLYRSRRDEDDQLQYRPFGSQTHLNGYSSEQQRLSRRDLHEVQQKSHTPFVRTQSVPLYKQAESAKPRVIEHKIHVENDRSRELEQQEQLRQQQENKKKKFKFQSTLRVMERKKIEAQLSREAEEKERQRLREIEALRQVEEEFQRKRLQKANVEADAAKVNGKQADSWDDCHNNNNNNHNNNNNNINNNVDFRNKLNSRSTKNTERSSSASVVTSSASTNSGQKSSKSSVDKATSNHSRMHLSKRQEPEGAPSFSTTTDLRKELIHASRKRNAAAQSVSSHQSGGAGSEMTQELSEYRQEAMRQYCDYRRSARTSSASPARFAESSSDIFPLSRRTPVERTRQNRYRATVHPEIVCDIPVKPFPYMVKFSRLSGSTSNLIVEDRPSSGLGMSGGMTSGPSSVISDNYRRDWAHHIRGPGSSCHGGPGRASSVASLHSAPGYASDHLRHSVNDLSVPTDSPNVALKRKSPLFHKYSSSPPSSPLPPFSSSISEITDHDKDGSSIITSTNGGPSSGIFQLQPYNKAKGYRPVTFKPPPANAPIKLTSTTVN